MSSACLGNGLYFAGPPVEATPGTRPELLSRDLCSPYGPFQVNAGATSCYGFCIQRGSLVETQSLIWKCLSHPMHMMFADAPLGKLAT
jgi:hypothetical protein